MAQRAQVALSVDSRFPLPLPGMVHKDNHLVRRGEFTPGVALDFDVRIFIEAKEEGSLFPQMEVDFLQNGQSIAYCRSGYYLRRQSSGTKKKRAAEVPVENEKEDQWWVPSQAGWQYARVSGDYNPIHLINLFARIAGFPRKIIHGWYSVSRAAAVLQQERTQPIQQIDVEFKKPILIPSKAVFGYRSTDVGQDFQLHSPDRQIIFLNGHIQ